MSTRNITIVLNPIRNSLYRLEPPAPIRETVDAWACEDSS